LTYSRSLTEYGAVSAEPIASESPGSPAVARPEDGPGRVGLDVRTLDWMRPLLGEYAFNFQHIAPLYAGDPASKDAWESAIRRSQAHPRDRAAIAEIVALQQEHRGAPPAAREAAARLRDPNTVVVATGQQAGAFGGPLFTLLKAVTAIQLAERTSAEHGVPAVPVFWVDAEDHDWVEVRSCTVLDADFQPKTLTLADLDGAGDLPVASLKLDERVEQTIAELTRVLAKTEFSSWVDDAVRAAYRPGTGMAQAFSTWIESVLGSHGLVVFEAADPAAKRLAAPVFVRELEFPGRTAELAAAAGQQLAARSHQPQVAAQAGNIALFYLDGKRRSSATAIAVWSATRPSPLPPSRRTPPTLLRTSAPTSCCVRSCRTRCFPPSVTCPARASSRTWVSCAACTSTSVCRCR
jgi:uncharacterized protein YllA (UPF0747 family)